MTACLVDLLIIPFVSEGLYEFVSLIFLGSFMGPAELHHEQNEV